MFNRSRLACSFCGKSAAEVSKLVAGPRVYICDACVATAARIMSETGGDNRPATVPAPGIWRRLGDWLVHRGGRDPDGAERVGAA
jgi:ATP-dependent Clp protease ATP-binding subunit ClpX